MVNYKIAVVGTGIYTTAETLEEAQDVALTEARELTRVCGFAVGVEVYNAGVQNFDGLGRDVTASFLVGVAQGRIEKSNAFVSWRPTVTKQTGAQVAA